MKPIRIRHSIVFLMILALCLLHGIYIFFKSNQVIDESFFVKPVKIPGQIDTLAVKKTYYWQFNLKTDQGLIKVSWYQMPHNIKLKPGQVWQFELKLKKLRPMSNFYGFDYASFLKQQGVIAMASVIKNKAELISDHPYDHIINRLRLKIKNIIESSLENMTYQAMIPIFTALLIGDKSQMSYQQKQVFQKTATAHLMAISGLHIGLIAFWAYLVMRFFWSLFPRGCMILPAQKAAWIFALIIALGYSLLAGFAIPTQRALIMLFFFAYFYLFDLSVSKRIILMLAFISISLFNPYAIFSAGFWLSFLAVSFLIFVFSGRIAQGGFFNKLLLPQVVAMLSLLPITAFLFDGISLSGFLANSIAVPFVSFIAVPFLLISLVAYLISHVLGIFFFQIIAFIFSYLWQFLAYLASIDLFYLPIFIYPSFLFLSLSMLGVIIFFMPFHWFIRCLGLFFSMPLFFYKPKWDDHILAKMLMLDVGHGLSIIFQQKDYTLVYDVGNRLPSGLTQADFSLIPYLKANGIRKINRLIISHSDMDHSGGFLSLKNRIKIDQLDASSDKNLFNFPRSYCKENASWQIRGVSYRYLNKNSKKIKDNNQSCVLSIGFLNHQILIPGDIEKKAEKYLVDYHYYQLKSDILVAPHHGSQSSSTVDFLKAVNPKLILVANGSYRNQYFPHQKIKKRYQQLHVPYLETKNFGAIEIIFHQNGKINIKTKLLEKS